MIRDLAEQRVLEVELTSLETKVERVQPGDLLTLLGGRGIAAKLLYERLAPGIDPLGAQNVLVLSTGSLTGTSAPSAGRSCVTCKGPATGLYLKVSAGGHLGAELKYAGYDYLVITGQAEHPVYLWINDGEVAIRDAGHLWGCGTREADQLIKQELGDDEIQTAVIGPGGENRVLFASIIFSLFNSASRGGVGAVMGSKNLKAIAVRGRGGLRVAQGEEFAALAGRTRRKLAEDTTSERLFKWGTAGDVAPANEADELASYNFSRVGIAGAEKIGGQYLEQQGYLVGREACFSCSIACHRYVRTKEHRYGLVQDAGPEYESVCALGAQCGTVDTEGVIKANQLCNDYGLDTISTGHVISWAMECRDRGLLKEEWSDGLDLQFGDVESELQLITQIALREQGWGDLLADGVHRAAQRVGGDSWKWAIQAKGLEQSAVDTRMAKGYALAFAVNPRGPDHLMTECLAEFGGTPEARALIREITGDDRYADSTLVDKRAEIVRWHEDCYAASDALGFCAFSTTAAYGVNPKNMARLFGLALGIEFSEQELMMAGRRIVTLERCFNVREGARREHDKLPWRMMNEPVRSGRLRGHVTGEGTLAGMLDQYYGLHGWNLLTGIPERRTLELLGIEALASATGWPD
jgi:aldehyde:ferredoxin oxidoreductase